MNIVPETGTEDEDKTLIEPVTTEHSECRLDNVMENDIGGTAVFEGVQHEYILDLPNVTEGAPLVVMLHGYGESPEGFRQKTAFEKDGNEKGYAVAYVKGAPSPEDATSANGWNSGIGISSNNDVEFLCAFVNYLCERYPLDDARVFAVGFSNGAFMTHRLAVEANDTFAAVVSVAGMMPESIWNDRPSMCEIGVLQITGEKDDVVPKNSDGSARFSKAPAIENVMEYYVEKNGLYSEDETNIGKKAVIKKYTSADSEKQVWDIFIPDGRHSWPDEKITGFNINQVIIEFFDTFK